MTAEKPFTRRSRPIALTLRFWTSLFSVWLFFASLQTTASEVHPVGPIALVGAQVLDGYDVAPISDGVVVYEDGVITAVGQLMKFRYP